MGQPKKITIDYTGSVINTVKVFAYLFLITGIISSVDLFFETGRYEIIVPVILTFVGSIIMFLLETLSYKNKNTLTFKTSTKWTSKM